MNQLKTNKSIFESIKHTDEFGNEYWKARELQKVLEYSQWRRFNEVIQKAMKACEGSNYKVSDNFANVGKIVKTGVSEKTISDYKLSRYACYLISMNGDSKKNVIALAQTYFAIQTRKQELIEEEYKLLSEDEKRIKIRKLTKKGNFNLNQTASKAGVKNFDRFHNAGYKGLYNGETANDIAKRKKLRYHEDILDNMGSEELSANLFRITQTDAKLKREKVDNEYKADDVHFEVGKAIRKAIKEVGGVMPEDLPTPISNIKELENKHENVL